MPSSFEKYGVVVQARQVFRSLRRATRALPLTYEPFEKGSSENFYLFHNKLISSAATSILILCRARLAERLRGRTAAVRRQRLCC